MKPAMEIVENGSEILSSETSYSRIIEQGGVKRGYGVLVLEDGTRFAGSSFGYDGAVSGELVFCTGMVGYPEALTDASFAGQILTMTYPIMGNYGVPESSLWEDDKIHVAGLIVSNYIDTPSHADSIMTLSTWLKREHVPALEIKDTRALTQHIRKHGVMLGKIVFREDIAFHDPNEENLVARVSTTKVLYASSEHKSNEEGRKSNEEGRKSSEEGRKTTRVFPTIPDAGEDVYSREDPCGLPLAVDGLAMAVDGLAMAVDALPMGADGLARDGDALTIVLIDCGAKRNIVRSLVAKGVRVVTVPWDYDLFAEDTPVRFDGILVSNGPGNPKMAGATIETLRKAMQRGVPTMGICLGHQLLALAAGGDTYKLKFGHRSQNQPSLLNGTKRCYITTQNHGFAVGRLPEDFEPWFVNANDGSNEGMRHKSRPFFSVQFHPEAAPGPMDTDWIFSHFLDTVREHVNESSREGEGAARG